jgi:hypothetical protein
LYVASVVARAIDDGAEAVFQAIRTGKAPVEVAATYFAALNYSLMKWPDVVSWLVDKFPTTPDAPDVTSVEYYLETQGFKRELIIDGLTDTGAAEGFITILPVVALLTASGGSLYLVGQSILDDPSVPAFEATFQKACEKSISCLAARLNGNQSLQTSYAVDFKMSGTIPESADVQATTVYHPTPGGVFTPEPGKQITLADGTRLIMGANPAMVVIADPGTGVIKVHNSDTNRDYRYTPRGDGTWLLEASDGTKGIVYPNGQITNPPEITVDVMGSLNGSCTPSERPDSQGVCWTLAEWAEYCISQSGCPGDPDCSYYGYCCVLDCAGVCNGSARRDCAGVCNGNALLDCAGVCNGSAQLDCAGICNGGATLDKCGVCGGDGTSCCPSVCPPGACEIIVTSGCPDLVCTDGCCYDCCAYSYCIDLCYDNCNNYNPECCEMGG